MLSNLVHVKWLVVKYYGLKNKQFINEIYLDLKDIYTALVQRDIVETNVVFC